MGIAQRYWSAGLQAHHQKTGGLLMLALVCGLLSTMASIG